MEGYCEEDFNKNILEIFNMSEILHDNFKIHEKNSKFYLSKIEKVNLNKNIINNDNCDDINIMNDLGDNNSDIEEFMCESVDQNVDKAMIQNSSDQIISIEYHVLYHPNYQVPALYFNAYTGTNLLKLLILN